MLVVCWLEATCSKVTDFDLFYLKLGNTGYSFKKMLAANWSSCSSISLKHFAYETSYLNALSLSL
ncbi:hypothetical protein KFK09_025967 [Dendrobium nobile]|uniref:Uncharacterized protein n=1 Tax=Dendrobium nobile TaxID=94219 RepID=A0A8T3A5C2_DENNO|nr:hypothetical protein KFK09_025967 [Dendrobium nobile]